VRCCCGLRSPITCCAPSHCGAAPWQPLFEGALRHARSNTQPPSATTPRRRNLAKSSSRAAPPDRRSKIPAAFNCA
jgi:hypothetical protein